MVPCATPRRYRCYASRRLVANDADLVAVGIAHIGAVIIGMIVRPQAGLALVLAAVGDRGRVGGVNRRPGVGLEPDGDAVADARCLLVERAHDPELRPPALAGVAQAVGGGLRVQG